MLNLKYVLFNIDYQIIFFNIETINFQGKISIKYIKNIIFIFFKKV